MKLLIVDDDPKFRSFLSRGLAESDFECEQAANAEAAERLLADARDSFDMILLDVMMPGASGWEFLAALRESGDQTPVVFLTARHQVEERVRGLELGADDYVIKPFELSELVARIHAVIRRKRSLPTLELGDLRMDLGRRVVERGGTRIEVSAREFDLLRELLESPGTIRSRPELLAKVWGIEFDPGTNVVAVAVARLRSRLDKFGPPLIHTVVGSGYCLAERPPVAGDA